MTTLKSCLNMLIVLLLFACCFPAMSKSYPQEKRIVSAGGSITEILYALGASQHIVATDTSSLFPAQANTLPKVGYYRQLSTEGVLAMQPHSIYAAKGAGPQDVISQLTNAGVDVQIFEQEKSVAGLFNLIQQIGEKANKRQQADALTLSVRSQLDKVMNDITGRREKVVFLMSASERGLMAAGNNTVPQLIMELAGVDNPYANVNGFKPVSVESFLSLSPKEVLIATHQTGGMTPSQLCMQPALRQWAAVQGCRLHIVDSLLFLGLTPRLPMAVSELLNIVNTGGTNELQVSSRE